MRSKSKEFMQDILDYVDDYYEHYKSSPSTREIAKALKVGNSTVYRYLVDMNDNGMLEYDGEKIVTPTSKKFETKSIKAAILKSVSCGLPLLEEEYIESYVSLPEKLFGRGEFFILTVNGDSMIDADIIHEDIVIIKKQSEYKDGDIVVALLDGSNTLKRIYFDKKNQTVILHPENKAMSDIIAKDVVVQGVVVKVIKNL